MSSNISLFSDQKHLAGEMESEPDEESQDAQVINVIPVHFDETYEELGESSPQTAAPGSAKGKYYKQTYRKAWEQMPDFKGWLRGVQGEPTRAYCMYCEKTLHAHRLSLLKHTCTIRHQKAAQIHNIRKSKSDNSDTQEENKIKRYQIENIRRKHNYLPLIVEILKLLAKEGKLMPLYEKAKERTLKKNKQKSKTSAT
ncbi:uncharacterized protein LOC108744303 [Agrilus planipennis]|uniref:Uncharacterized protein LOC108744303 n=1 Tax=Agrilus planipennis TaxID=224129 RepID=A0A1W4XHP9_AGRPL|nr:uncharacterized protein LOC108744303 [Agrilus planipennis]